ncbi:MAG: 1,4-dihydroxy-2-naphthoate octaprenyltransferase [Candidatus Cryptobacteroides sp.]
MEPRLILSAMRLRTLPLSLSGVMLGIMLAAADYHISMAAAVFIILTAASLQILSNISNELGDYQRGTVSGQGRNCSVSLAEGKMDEKDLKRMVIFWVVMAVLCGLAMIHFSYGTLFCLDSFVLMIIGFFSIKAAMKYTLGKNPYGYKGLGDLYVFIFFGFVSVLGAYFVMTHSFGTFLMLLPAAAIGFFSMAVLNVNNIRDMESDRLNRVTVAMKLGERGAKIYQTVLILLGWTAMTVFASLRIFDPWHFLYLLTLPLYVVHLVIVWKNLGQALDKALPLLVMSTFLLSLLAGLGFLVYLFI